MSMRTLTLIIMRHAKSDWDTSAQHDFDRPLSRRGIRDTGRMGKWLSSTDHLPDQIIASPALRAKQTVKFLCETAGLDVEKIVWEKAIYSTGMQILVDLAKKYFAKNKTVMLVGHNPAMDELLHYLSDIDVSATHSGKYMTTANIAIFSLNGDSKNFLQAGSARLLVIARPKEIDV